MNPPYKRPCRKDQADWPWPCSCDDCASKAARAWTDYVDSENFVVGAAGPLP